MPELTIRDIDLVTKDIIRQDVNHSHLLDELVDHVCCDIESEMEKGLPFHDAYQRVKQRIGPGRFREIQKQTLYAVDSKYRFMKKTMKISGIAGTIMFGVAALFKIQHWPAAGIMLTIGAFILALVFLPSALAVMWKENRNQSRIFLFVSSFITGLFFIAGTLFKVQHWPLAGIILTLSVFTAVFMFIPSLLYKLFGDPEKKRFRPVYVVAAVGLVLYLVGLLFKIQHWPLASALSIIGILLLGYLSLPWYSYLAFRDETKVSGRFLYLIIAFIIIIIPATIINLNLQSSYESGYYPNQEKQIALHNYLVKHNRIVMDNVHDSTRFRNIMLVHAAAGKLLGSVEDIQSRMVRFSEGDNAGASSQSAQMKNSDAGMTIIYGNLTRPFQTSPVQSFLLPGSEARASLESGIQDYVKEISALVPSGKMKTFQDLLNPSNFLTFTQAEGGVSLMSGLHSLELLKSSILATESGVMNIIANQ